MTSKLSINIEAFFDMCGWIGRVKLVDENYNWVILKDYSGMYDYINYQSCSVDWFDFIKDEEGNYLLMVNISDDLNKEPGGVN